MSTHRQIVFPPFVLDIVAGILIRGSEKIHLRPKSISLLQFLLEHPKQLFTKEELTRAIWAKTRVVDGVLKVSVAEIRRALHDDPRSPKFIETITGRGYRFIGQIQLKHRSNAGSVHPNKLRGIALRLQRSAVRDRKEFWSRHAGGIKIALTLPLVAQSLKENVLAGDIELLKQYASGTDITVFVNSLVDLYQRPDIELVVKFLGNGSQAIQKFCQLLLSFLQ